jgi:pimeloyl-ACP methyl ester carboxylesterase
MSLYSLTILHTKARVLLFTEGGPMKYFTLSLALILVNFQAVAEDLTEISLTDLRAKYADKDTRYIDVDGAEIHYRDEGQGPVVLLLHASWFNLKTWDQLAETLTPNYRVIRLDFPNVGLSGPETKEPPGGKFDLIGRNVEIVEEFVEKLNLDQFALIATSSGGSVGFRYAAQHTEHVNRLVLINSAGMPRTASTDPNRNRSETAQWDDMPIKPPEFWAYSVNQNFPSDVEAPEWLIELAFDVNRRGNTTPVSKYFFKTGDPQSILSEIKAPTLIMWGMSNPTVVHLEADVIEHWMTGAPTLIKKYEGLGHYPYIEAPDLVNGDIATFLAGDFDDDLRQTQRVKVAR